jgi:hypothetical protein
MHGVGSKFGIEQEAIEITAETQRHREKLKTRFLLKSFIEIPPFVKITLCVFATL